MEQTTQQQLQQLLGRYLSDDLTDAERKTLALLVEASSDDQLSEALQPYWVAASDGVKLSDEKSQEILRQVFQHKNEAPVVPLAAEGRSQRQNRWWWAAASVLLVAMAVVFWQKRPTKHELANNTQQDVMPGRSGAVLTLTDGTQVLLDSLNDGWTTAQGSTTVSISQGRLAYDAGQGANTAMYNTMSTPKGRQYQLVLPDGSQVWLNAASSIRFPTNFTGGERKVSITGEAYFDVAKDAAHPFVVSINDKATVTVLGTSFNINSYADNGMIATTLVEGSVKMAGSNNTLMLKPGQQAQYKLNEATIHLNEHPDMEQVVAWKEGLFNFNQSDLHTVLQQLSRWYDIDIQYEGSVPNKQFNGEITRDLRLSQVLDILKRVGIGFRIEGNTLVVTD